MGLRISAHSLLPGDVAAALHYVPSSFAHIPNLSTIFEPNWLVSSVPAPGLPRDPETDLARHFFRQTASIILSGGERKDEESQPAWVLW